MYLRCHRLDGSASDLTSLGVKKRYTFCNKQRESYTFEINISIGAILEDN